MKQLPSFLLVSLLLLSGCGPQSEFNRARAREKKGDYYKAWQKYQEFVARHPAHSLAAEAQFRAGLMAQKGMNDCFAANIFFEQVLAKYPQSDPWARAAALASLNCPDYFPLIPGSTWEEGDSDTKGGYAKTTVECQAASAANSGLPSEEGKLVRTVSAGSKQVSKSTTLYRKEKDRLLEFPDEKDPRFKTILKWPLSKGTTWTTPMDGRFFQYEIDGEVVSVKVAAGEFSNCIRVRSSIQGSAVSVKYEYYAPGVGHVLTTLPTKDGDEKRITELLSYTIAEFPDIGGEKK